MQLNAPKCESAVVLNFILYFYAPEKNERRRSFVSNFIPEVSMGKNYLCIKHSSNSALHPATRAKLCS
jgi:hypothetical protein